MKSKRGLTIAAITFISVALILAFYSTFVQCWRGSVSISEKELKDITQQLENKMTNSDKLSVYDLAIDDEVFPDDNDYVTVPNSNKVCYRTIKRESRTEWINSTTKMTTDIVYVSYHFFINSEIADGLTDNITTWDGLFHIEIFRKDQNPYNYDFSLPKSVYYENEFSTVKELKDYYNYEFGKTRPIFNSFSKEVVLENSKSYISPIATDPTETIFRMPYYKGQPFSMDAVFEINDEYCIKIDGTENSNLNNNDYAFVIKDLPNLFK